MAVDDELERLIVERQLAAVARLVDVVGRPIDLDHRDP